MRGFDQPQYRLRVGEIRMAESEEVVITRHGRPAGVLIGFGTEEDWFD